jgi:hypothetical protein
LADGQGFLTGLTRDAFRRIARASGNPNPIFQDEEYAAQTRCVGIIPFPMFSASFSDSKVDGLVKSQNLGSSVIPAKAGIQLIQSRQGRDGPRLPPG